MLNYCGRSERSFMRPVLCGNLEELGARRRHSDAAADAIRSLDDHNQPFGCDNNRRPEWSSTGRIEKFDEHQDGLGEQLTVVSEDNNVGMAVEQPSEDGYNWRKYGQKQVKGSEFPRSYYKCTHSGCQVKKTVERSYDGQITEIIYKGHHSHPINIISSDPVPERLPFSHNDSERVVVESSEIESEFSNPLLSATSKKNLNMISNVVGVMYRPSSSSTTLSTLIKKEDGSTTVTTSFQPTNNDVDVDDDYDYDYDQNDEYSSRRMARTCAYLQSGLASRHARVEKVVVQVESSVDILEDGYRWRKYGQKVVKGNPNPRSYYKCTSPGCSVRKHVERVSEDMKSVLTTYEGKHNHEVPTARNGGGNNNSSQQVVVSESQIPTSSLPRNELLDHRYILPRFQTKLDVNEGSCYLRSSGFSNDTSPFLDTKSNDPMQELAFHYYGGPNFNNGTSNFHQVAAASICSTVHPEYPICIPMELHEPCNLALSGFGNTNVHGNPTGFSTADQCLPLQKQQQQTNDGYDINARFLRPLEKEQSDSAILYDFSFHVNRPVAHMQTAVYDDGVISFN